MLDLGQDRVGILVPGENFGVVIVVAQEVFNGGNEIRHAFELVLPRFRGQVRKEWIRA